MKLLLNLFSLGCKLLKSVLLHFSVQRRVHTDYWRNCHLQLTGHLLWSCVSLVTDRFAATVSRSQKTFSSSPESRDILGFIAPCYWLNPWWEHLAWRQVVLPQQRQCCAEEHTWEALAILQEGTKEEHHWDCFGFVSIQTQISKKRTKKSWEGGEELHFSLSTQCVTLTPCHCALIQHSYRIINDF